MENGRNAISFKKIFSQFIKQEVLILPLPFLCFRLMSIFFRKMKKFDGAFNFILTLKRMMTHSQK